MRLLASASDIAAAHLLFQPVQCRVKGGNSGTQVIPAPLVI